MGKKDINQIDLTNIPDISTIKAILEKNEMEFEELDCEIILPNGIVLEFDESHNLIDISLC